MSRAHKSALALARTLRSDSTGRVCCCAGASHDSEASEPGTCYVSSVSGDCFLKPCSGLYAQWSECMSSTFDSTTSSCPSGVPHAYESAIMTMKVRCRPRDQACSRGCVMQRSRRLNSAVTIANLNSQPDAGCKAIDLTSTVTATSSSSGTSVSMDSVCAPEWATAMVISSSVFVDYAECTSQSTSTSACGDAASSYQSSTGCGAGSDCFQVRLP